ARFEGSVIDRVGFAAQAGECGARIGKSVYADAEPRDAVAAGHTDHAKKQNDRKCDGDGGNGSENTEVEHDHNSDEKPEQDEKFSLCEQVRFAGFVDQLGDIAHGAMYGEVFQPAINRESEDKAENAKQDSKQQQLVAVDTKKLNLG